jgi:succinyl-CoA synthetase beta subunit
MTEKMCGKTLVTK